MSPCRFVLAALLAVGPVAELSAQEARLELGRSVWLDTCEGCHAYGIAGAPIPGKPAQWRARVAQGKDILYQHALEGFFGPKGTMMPARGGNEALTDEQVTAAVDYMVYLATTEQQSSGAQ